MVRELHRIALMAADQNIMAVVRERLPEFTLPVRTHYRVRFNIRSFAYEFRRDEN